MVSLNDYALLRAARDAGTLKTRVRALIAAFDRDTVAKMNDLLDGMEDLRYEADPWLKVWGVKLGLDGGIEAGATEEPYLGDPHFHGHLLFEDPDAMVPVVDAAVRRGWRVGTHAYGDRAARVLLDVYERVLANNPGLPAGTLVMEHGGLAGAEQRARAVKLGVPVTIQQPLLHDAAAAQREYWGPQRVAALFPAREWIDQGAQVSGGSDYPVGQIGAMRSIWGMITRETVIGVQGPEHAISYAEAIALHTVQAARLNREEDLRGTLTPGRLADFTVWAQDPAECPIESLAELDPTHTLLGGRLVHGPETEST
jgi:predicted amidohydrolase YtcJ